MVDDRWSHAPRNPDVVGASATCATGAPRLAQGARAKVSLVDDREGAALILAGVGGHEQDDGRPAVVGQLTGGFNAPDARHVDVHQHQHRMRATRSSDRGLARSDLSDQLEPFLAGHQLA